MSLSPFNWPEVTAIHYSSPEAAEEACKRMQEWQQAFDAMKEALASVPNPGYGQDAQRWTDEDYWPWWHKTRQAALALVDKVRR